MPWPSMYPAYFGHWWQPLVATIGGNSRGCSCRMCAAAREHHHHLCNDCIQPHPDTDCVWPVQMWHMCVCALPEGVRDPDALLNRLLLPNLSLPQPYS